MQGSLSLLQRLSLPFLAALQSHRRRSAIMSGGCCSVFPPWKALEFERPGAWNSRVRRMHERTGPGGANDLAWQGTLTLKGLGFVVDRGNTRMKGLGFRSFASTALYPQTTRSLGFCRDFVAPGDSYKSVLKLSYGIHNQGQHQTALRRSFRQSDRGYARKAVVVAAGKHGAQELLLKTDLGFERVGSESDSITTFYGSDISSFSEHDAADDNERTVGKQRRANGLKEKRTKGSKAFAEDSDSESESDDEQLKGTDHRKVKLRPLEKADKSKREKKAVGKYDAISTAKGEIAGKCEDFDIESEDEEEDKINVYEKKSANAQLTLKEKLDEDFQKSMKKLKEKLDEDFLKAMKEEVEEEQQKRESKKLKAAKRSGEEIDSEEADNKKIESESKGSNDEDSDSDEEANSRLKITGDLASDSEYDMGDGVRDLGNEAVAKDEENLVLEGDDIANQTSGLQNEFVDEVEGEVDDLDEDDDFWDDEDGDVVVGDGGTGGGVVLGGKEWGKKAVELAEQVVAECGEDLSIFAFKISSDRVIRVRLDKLSDRYGSPTMTDIEGFSRRFSIALEEAGEAGDLPKDLDVEVSSPGAERVVRVPDDLERFKQLPMFVQYLDGEKHLEEKDGVFELDSLDMDGGVSVWKIANVKLNREVKGRGRPLNSKQKKWRASLPFASLKQVRLYIDV